MVILALYAGLTLALGVVAAIADSQTTGPMSVADAWLLLSVALAVIPIAAYAAVEMVWWNRRRASHRSLPNSALSESAEAVGPEGAGRRTSAPQTERRLR